MRCSVLFATLCLATYPAIAQQPSAEDSLSAFRVELKPRLMLRGFSGDPVTNFDWSTSGLSMNAPRTHTLGVYALNSVKLHKDIVELTGKRSTLLKEPDGKFKLMGEAPVTIRIALNGADLVQVLPQLKSQLFYPSLDSAVREIPVQYQDLLPTSTEFPKRSQPHKPPSSCSAPGQVYKHPTVTHWVDPQFSEEARRAHFSGNVEIAFTIDEQGHPSDLWLARPAGLGLDEEATKAVAQYTFKPALCDEVAITTSLMIDVNFNIH